MIKLIRTAIVLIVPLLFWVGAGSFPDLLKADNLRVLCAVITVLWSIDFVFLQRLASLTTLEALTSAELRNFSYRVKHIRKRAWRMAIICLICSILIWVVTSAKIVSDPVIVAVVVGVLFAICVSYIVVFPFWFNELHDFQDRLKTKVAEAVKRDAELKEMNDAKKKH